VKKGTFFFPPPPSFCAEKVTAPILFPVSAIQICKSETKGVNLYLEANQHTQELEHMRSPEIVVCLW